MTFIVAILVIAVIIVLWAVSCYNKLVQYRVEAENSWSQIDVQLKRRHDLIPNLVETVKGTMNFEQETLTKVMQARAAAMGAGNTSDRLKAESEITGCLGKLLAVWENYPVLKSNQNALHLQEELTTTENRISYTRGHYNDVVANYNTMLEQLPSSIVANSSGFKKKDYFQVSESEKSVPKVNLK